MHPPVQDTTQIADALAALRGLRDATERALAALDRDDPDSAARAVLDGSRLSSVLSNLSIPPDGGAGALLRREADHIRVLQAIAIDRTDRRIESIHSELESLAGTKRGLRGYRPAVDPDGHAYQIES
ncbi:MAG: hypothetical protein HY286_19770 [Planctomycetes bacterium]|nr:hypothetical protein [Planctomycetota bacterium]